MVKNLPEGVDPKLTGLHLLHTAIWRRSTSPQKNLLVRAHHTIRIPLKLPRNRHFPSPSQVARPRRRRNIHIVAKPQRKGFKVKKHRRNQRIHRRRFPLRMTAEATGNPCPKIPHFLSLPQSAPPRSARQHLPLPAVLKNRLPPVQAPDDEAALPAKRQRGGAVQRNAHAEPVVVLVKKGVGRLIDVVQSGTQRPPGFRAEQQQACRQVGHGAAVRLEIFIIGQSRVVAGVVELLVEGHARSVQAIVQRPCRSPCRQIKPAPHFAVVGETECGSRVGKGGHSRSVALHDCAEGEEAAIVEAMAEVEGGMQLLPCLRPHDAAPLTAKVRRQAKIAGHDARERRVGGERSEVGLGKMEVLRQATDSLEENQAE